MPLIAPQAGPQEKFASSTADIAIYGGSAGGGKTFALTMEAARYTGVKNYGAVIFRRTGPELVGPGSVWLESRKLYPHVGGVAREASLDWRFPKTNALIEFRHLQYDASVFGHQSKQYDFIGFDELTHYSEMQFWYMLSRLRSVSGAPKRVRGTCNPDPDSFVRKLIDWWIGKNGLAIEERSGVIRWFVRLDDSLVWGASPAEVVAHDPQRIRMRGAPRRPDDDRPEPMSLTFVRAKASDNKILMRADPGYLARLNVMIGAQRKRLRDGDWNARDSAGDYFNRTWCKILDRVDEKTVVRRVRFWDKAATSPSTSNPEPAWTRGIRIAQLNTGQWVVEDRKGERAGPSVIDALMLQTAHEDGVGTEIGCWVDPGQAGKVDEEHMQKLFAGFAFKGVPARENKRIYAAVWSPYADKGKLDFLQREYLPDLFAQLESFPTGQFADDMDAISGCFQLLLRDGFAIGYDGEGDGRHTQGDAWAQQGDRVRDDADADDEIRDSAGGRGECW
jgi:predicted phage terminase large subunit-like protein